MEVLGIYERETKKRNGSEWVVSLRTGALLELIVLRDVAPRDKDAAIKAAAEVVLAREAGEVVAPAAPDADEAMAMLGDLMASVKKTA